LRNPKYVGVRRRPRRYATAHRSSRSEV
jgi:hypothetical protein